MTPSQGFAIRSLSLVMLVTPCRFADRRRDNPAAAYASRKNLAQRSDGPHHLAVLEPRPLHAHDEVIDAQELVVALDLRLHGRLVPDDEAILHEGFEPLIERFG